MPLIYKEMSLFDAPSGSYLTHAVNHQGVWGSGIAKEFKKRFPKSFEEYKTQCIGTHLRPGKTFITSENIICLCTSENYGKDVSSPELIIYNTSLALESLSSLLKNPPITIYSNKFNSGLFKVPWLNTETLLIDFLNENPWITWIVCEQKEK